MQKIQKIYSNLFFITILFMHIPSIILSMDIGSGNPALIKACQEGDTQTVEEFLNSGEDFNRVFRSGYKTKLLMKDHMSMQNGTYLHIAAHYGHIPIVQLLVSRGISVDIHNGGHAKETPLQFAVMAQNMPMTKALVKLGADVNNASTLKPALHHAIWALNCELVAYLLQHNADPNLKSNQCENSLFLTTDLVVSHQGIPQRTLQQREDFEALSLKALSIIELLRNHGGNTLNEIQYKKAHYERFTFAKAAKLDKRFACALMVPLPNNKIRHKEALLRYKTFLLCLKRNNVNLPKDIKILLLAYLPVISKYAQLTHLVPPNLVSKEAFMCNFLDDAWNELPALVNNQERAVLRRLFTTKIEERNEPTFIKDLTNDPDKKMMLDPETWANVAKPKATNPAHKKHKTHN